MAEETNGDEVEVEQKEDTKEEETTANVSLGYSPEVNSDKEYLSDQVVITEETDNAEKAEVEVAPVGEDEEIKKPDDTTIEMEDPLPDAETNLNELINTAGPELPITDDDNDLQDADHDSLVPGTGSITGDADDVAASDDVDVDEDLEDEEQQMTNVVQGTTETVLNKLEEHLASAPGLDESELLQVSLVILSC